MRQTKRGVKIAWNPGATQLAQEKVMAKFLPYVEVLVLNKDEAVELIVQLIPKLKKPQAISNKLKNDRRERKEIK